MSFHELPTATNDLETQQAARARINNDAQARASSPPSSPSLSSSSTGDDSDSDWNDWESDAVQQNLPCRSLFDESVHAGAASACAYDVEKHGVDLDAISKRLKLDFYARIRLVNYIRREKVGADVVLALTGGEALFSDDQYLHPVLEDDPLLRGAGEWSDDDEVEREGKGKAAVGPATMEEKDREILRLKRKLQQAQTDLEDFRSLVRKQFQESDIAKALNEGPAVLSASEQVKKNIPTRDDDTHYFDSYSSNEIHHVMLTDSVRTSTYASFILNSPDIFEDAVVLDVGCGTGILSLLAARAGAKRVFAVDASVAIAEKARRTVEANNLQNVITVIPGKVEDITLPDGFTEVDIIISEWMGYALLYESMLDSVIVARDRFLKPRLTITSTKAVETLEEALEGPSVHRGGILAPSQCRMLLGICAAHEVYKQKIEFWNDVYGFDMSSMVEDAYAEAIIEVVPRESILSDTAVINDINLSTITTRDLSFVAPFELKGTTPQRITAHALLLYFDTFFAADGIWQSSLSKRAQARDESGPILAEVWRVPSPSRTRAPSASSASDHQPSEREKARLRRRSSVRVPVAGARESFTTGPESVATHWKQTLFLLREPIVVHEKTVVKGTFHCRKSEENSRELDVEIHYVVRDVDYEGVTTESPMYVQSYKVR